VSAGVNGLRAGGDYLAIPEAETYRCSGDHCRTRVTEDGAMCEPCRLSADSAAEAWAEHERAEDHRRDDTGWREARRA
jgi:hypothetical protein